MTDQRLSPYATLLLRVALGVLFLAHAGLKIFVFTPAGTAGYFASLGLPGFFAYPTIALEVLGGVALILGVYVAPIALVLAAELLGTIALVHGKAGFFFTATGGGWEYPAFWAISLVVLAGLGNGAYALNNSSAAK